MPIITSHAKVINVKMKTLLLSATVLAFAPWVARAELVNDFHCTLNKGVTVPHLYAFQQEWMAAAHKQGFDASYKTRIYFPLYSDVTTTEPMFFLWRGQFSGGEQLGKMLDWFPASEWAGRFAQIMNCSKSSLWLAAQ